MIAMDRTAPVSRAIVAKLGADVALTALVGQRIYDVAPARALPPEITIKLVTALDASTADTEAQALMFDIDVWDRYALGTDLSRPRLIMGHVRRILHLQAIAPAGCTVFALRCTGAQGPFRDPDGMTLHGVVTVSALAGHEAAG